MPTEIHTGIPADRSAAQTSPGRLFRMEGRLTELVVVGLLPEGVRMHNTFEGVIVDGEPAGAVVRGIDEFVVRADGTGVVDAREIVTAAGATLYADVVGYSHPPAGLPMPPLEAFLDPGFVWPDVEFTLQCAAAYRTSAPGLAELGRAVVVHLGTVNMATRALVIEGYRATAVTAPGVPVAVG